MQRLDRITGDVVGVKKLTLLIWISSACILCLSARDSIGQRTVPSEPFPAELDRYIAKVRAEWQIPGLAVAIVRNDSTLAAKGFGVRELGKPDAVDENTVFDVASLAKSFTATA